MTTVKKAGRLWSAASETQLGELNWPREENVETDIRIRLEAIWATPSTLSARTALQSHNNTTDSRYGSEYNCT
jgi:hypothetical protein